jgi:hypothetical protein
MDQSSWQNAVSDGQSRDCRGDSHDALAGHGVGLLIHPLDIPEALVLVLVIWTHHNGDDVHVQPQPRAERGAHILECGRKAGTDELGKVLMLVALDLLNDVVGNEVGAHLHGIVKQDVLDREIEQVRSVVDSKRDNGSVVVGEDSRDTDIESLKYV